MKEKRSIRNEGIPFHTDAFFDFIFYFISDYQPARKAITESGISPFT